MSKPHKQKKESKKANRRQNARWLVTITSVLILLLAIWLWYESLEEDNNLNSIGQGDNVWFKFMTPVELPAVRSSEWSTRSNPNMKEE